MEPKRLVKRHTDLDVYQTAFAAAMEIYHVSKRFPTEERYSLPDQIRRSSRSVCANLAEAWRKRRYKAAFASKLSDCETEAAETQAWIQFEVECGLTEQESARGLYHRYEKIIASLVRMAGNAECWTIP